jgi:hypothetical protein
VESIRAEQRATSLPQVFGSGEKEKSGSDKRRSLFIEPSALQRGVRAR